MCKTFFSPKALNNNFQYSVSILLKLRLAEFMPAHTKAETEKKPKEIMNLILII